MALSSSRRSIWGALPLLVALQGGAFTGATFPTGPESARADDAKYVELLSTHSLKRAPMDSAPSVMAVPARVGGAPTVVAVTARVSSGAESWLSVRFERRKGWISAQDTTPTGRPQLRRSLSRRLDRFLSQAGTESGAAIYDLQGWLLWARRAGTTRSLASDTKLFTAAIAIHRYGSSIIGLLKRILLPSNNKLAQMLSDRVGNGSPSRGARAAVRFAASLGTKVSLVDGSGLSPANRASPANVARFLVGLYEGSIYRTLVRALPVGGISGSLRDRMVSSPARGHCHAKPGMLSQVSTLSGYCRTHSGRQLAFSILISHHDTTTSSLLEDRMLSILVSRDRPSSTLGKP
jgi:hypothetical protein